MPITPKTPLKDIIHDFVHSKDPKFDKDSIKQRIKRALGAYYSMHNEEVELNEINMTKVRQFFYKTKKEVQDLEDYKNMKNNISDIHSAVSDAENMSNYFKADIRHKIKNHINLIKKHLQNHKNDPKNPEHLINVKYNLQNIHSLIKNNKDRPNKRLKKFLNSPNNTTNIEESKEEHLNNFDIFYTKKLNESNAAYNNLNVQFIGKYEKDGKKHILWRKGNYHYELTSNNEEGKGFKHITDWVNKSNDEIHNELLKNGYKRINESHDVTINEGWIKHINSIDLHFHGPTGYGVSLRDKNGELLFTHHFEKLSDAKKTAKQYLNATGKKAKLNNMVENVTNELKQLIENVPASVAIVDKVLDLKHPETNSIQKAKRREAQLPHPETGEMRTTVLKSHIMNFDSPATGEYLDRKGNHFSITKSGVVLHGILDKRGKYIKK